MALILPFDTETQNMVLWTEPSEHPGQPHIVQLAALLVDEDTREEVDAMDVIVKPDGWVIPDETAKIHGITHERAMDEGIPEREALDQFMAMHDRTSLRVAHNEDFDARIIRIAMCRFYGNKEEAEARFSSKPSFCTCNSARPICKLRSPRGYGFKKPKLSEAYKYFTGRELENAHNALFDVRGCLEVYWGIKSHTGAFA